MTELTGFEEKNVVGRGLMLLVPSYVDEDFSYLIGQTILANGRLVRVTGTESAVGLKKRTGAIQIREITSKEIP